MSIPQPTQGLVGTTQPNGPNTVIQLQGGEKHYLNQSIILISPITALLSFYIKMSYALAFVSIPEESLDIKPYFHSGFLNIKMCTHGERKANKLLSTQQQCISY